MASRSAEKNPLLNENLIEQMRSSGGFVSPFGDADDIDGIIGWPPEPPTPASIQQDVHDQQCRVASMNADALGPMYETSAQQPRHKDYSQQQSAEMGVGLGHGRGGANAKEHPLLNSAQFVGDPSSLNADLLLNEEGLDAYNVRLQKQHQQKLQQQYGHSDAPTLTRP